MKHTMKRISILISLAALLFAVSCTPEILTPVKAQLPEASKLTPVITIDQETNYVTFSVSDKGVVPIWIFGEERIDGKANKKYSYAQNDLTLRFREAGEHSVELKAYNANGISQGSQIVTFTMENTYVDPFDPAPYVAAVTGVWEWNYGTDGHFGCGENLSNPKGWWSCGANGKAGFLYDDTMEFTSDMKYIYDSEDGMAYANKGSEYESDSKTADEDYLFPVNSSEDHTYQFERVWNDAGIEEIWLNLSSGSVLSYVPHKSIVEEPHYLVMESSPSKMKKKLQLAAFVYTPDNTTGIAWYYEFVPKGKGGEVVVPDIEEPDDDDYTRELWDPSKVTVSYWYSAGDWSGNLHPEITEISNGYSVVIPDGIGGSEWQGQTHFTLDASVSASKTYNFKVTLNSTADCVATVKLAWEGNDNDHAFFYDGNVQLSAGEDVIYVKSHIKPDTDYDKIALFIDLGRTPAGETVKITDISLGEIIEGDNVWDSSKVTVSYWYSAADWSGNLHPEITEIAGGYSVVIPDGIGGSEWQGQTHLTMDGGVSASKKYNFQVVLKSTADCVATVKLAWEGNDNDHAFFYDNNVELPAGEAVTYVQKSTSPDVDYDKLALFIDLGRTPAGATVEITDIKLVEVVEAPDAWDSSKVTVSYWYSAGDWSGNLHPEITEIAGGYSVVIPDGIGGSEWQGQTHLTMDGGASASKKYTFCVTLNSSEDCVATVKLAWEGNDNDHAFFYDNNVALSAGENLVYTQKKISPDTDYDKLALFIDLGRTPAGATVKITDIHLYEK